MILATDLDGTFLGGKSLHKLQLYNAIRKNPDIMLVYVTGRGLESVIPLLNDPIIPNPDYIICDVGCTVVNGHTLAAVQPLQSTIEASWPGSIAIKKKLEHIEGIQYQDVPQQRRCSFITTDASSIAQVKEMANELDCEILYSADRYLDILPKGVNKGSTLVQLVKSLHVSNEEVLVAGDTLNDLSMYNCGFKGVVVGEAEAALTKATADNDLVYHAKDAGAGGILEAMRNWDRFARFAISNSVKEDTRTNDTQIAPQLLMLYHRFPYEVQEINGKKQKITPKSPNGILPTLQGFFANGRSGVWIAWEEVATQGTAIRNSLIDEQRYPNLVAAPVALTKNDIEIFYKVFSKEALWPVIFSFVEKARFNHHHWEVFVKVNRLFAERAAQEADHKAMVWIHDYNLWLVPGMLRQLRPDLTIGFFHHTSFPPATIFNILPWHREITTSLLQCDYIGFHIPRYVENFVDVAASQMPLKVLSKESSAPRFLTYSTALGVPQFTRAIHTGQRIVKLGANPVGIDTNAIADLMQQPSYMQQIEAMRKEMGDKKMILSVERMDYVKGPLEKVIAFEQFLQSYPEFHGKVEMVNICPPPAQGMRVYDKIQKDLEQAVGRINGKYSTLNWTPIRLFMRSMPFNEVVKYYALADIAWITPLRDGLNLVAKEYVTAQGYMPEKDGVLILSEFAGAAVEMQYALLTNPYDYQSLKESLLQALLMNKQDRQMRMQRLFEQVNHYDINYWADDFISGMQPATVNLLADAALEPSTLN